MRTETLVVMVNTFIYFLMLDIQVEAIVLTDVFYMTFEINNRARGAQKNIALPLFTSYDTLKEDFTLPHRFLVIPPGIHVDSWSPPGVQVEFLWQGAQPNFCLFPPGFHPFHITLYNNFHLSVDSTWTPAVLIIYFVGIDLPMKTKSHYGPINK